MKFEQKKYCVELKKIYIKKTHSVSVQKHNRNPDNPPIRSVLCPGLGTAVGTMPVDRCAFQVCINIVDITTHSLDLRMDNC